MLTTSFHPPSSKPLPSPLALGRKEQQQEQPQPLAIHEPTDSRGGVEYQQPETANLPPHGDDVRLSWPASPHPDPPLVELCRRGKLADVEAVIDRLRAANDHTTLSHALNHAHVWTEVEVDWGVVEHSFLWYDDTPLIAAARGGHAGVALVLLRTGLCDPTLESCHAVDRFGTALDVSRDKLRGLRNDVKFVSEVGRSFEPLPRDHRFRIRGSVTPEDGHRIAKHLAARAVKAVATLETMEIVLQTAHEMWPKAPYSGPAAGKRHSFTNHMSWPDEGASTPAFEGLKSVRKSRPHGLADNEQNELTQELNRRLDAALQEMRINRKGNESILDHHGARLATAIERANIPEDDSGGAEGDKRSGNPPNSCICGQQASKDCLDHLCGSCCNHDPLCPKHKRKE